MKEAWAVKPKDISTDQIVCTHYADIVIIGAGHAGTCAARAAAEAGANVFVLEQQERDKQWVLGIGEIRTVQWEGRKYLFSLYPIRIVPSPFEFDRSLYPKCGNTAQ